MRTTVTLEPAADAIVRRLMRERNLTFKEAVNEAIRGGARRSASRPKRFRTPTHPMGPPAVPIEKALRLAAELEDEELQRKLAARK